MQNLTMGKYNTAIGHRLMHNLMTGSSNVALGYEAGSTYGSSDGFQMGVNNITVGNFTGSGSNDATVSNNIYIGPSTSTSSTGVSNSIMFGSRVTLGISNESMINNIHHLNIPALTTSANGTGILLQYGGANADWVEASGGTYNSVEKIDTLGQWTNEVHSHLLECLHCLDWLLPCCCRPVRI